jgi:hypothetical protein
MNLVRDKSGCYADAMKNNGVIVPDLAKNVEEK